MKSLDVVLAVLALACFVLFVGIVAWIVTHVDLIIVLLIGIAMAIYDFWRTVLRPR